VTSFPDDPGAPVGGVEAVSVNLVQALTEFVGLEIHIVTTKRTYSSQRTERWGKAVVHRLPWAGGSTLRHAVGPGRRQIQEYLRQLAPDVVHAHDTYGLMIKGLDMPRVFTIHGFIHCDTLMGGGRWACLRSKLWKRAELAAWADQPHIISISPYVRERLAGVAKGAIHDIDNPVDEAFFEIISNEIRGRIFSAAVLSPLKNTLVLIEAFARLATHGVGASLRLAGAVTDANYCRHIEERIHRLRLQDRVALLGSIDRRHIQRELAEASVFVLVSLQENSPLGIEEAMAVGVPVLASNRCGMPYMVRDGESGFLVDPNDPDDIARRLDQLLRGDGLRRSMGAKSREIALDRFDPAKVAARTREVYLLAILGSRRK